MTQDADVATTPLEGAQSEPTEEPVVAKMLPAWGPYVLGAIFVLQILIIAVAGVTGLRFGAEVKASRQDAIVAAKKAEAYAAYAECLSQKSPAECVRPAD